MNLNYIGLTKNFEVTFTFSKCITFTTTKLKIKYVQKYIRENKLEIKR